MKICIQYCLALLIVQTLAFPVDAFAAMSENHASTAVLNPVDFDLSPDAREEPRLRSMNAAIFIFPDRKFATVSSGQEMFSVNEDGEFILPSEEGEISGHNLLFKYLVGGSVISIGLDHPHYTITKNGQSFTIRFSSQGKGVIMKNRRGVDYALAPGVTLSLFVKDSRIHKELRVSPKVIPPLDTLHFNVETSSDLMPMLNDSVISVVDQDQKQVFTTDRPFFLTLDRSPMDHPISIVQNTDSSYRYQFDSANLENGYILDPTAGPSFPGAIVDDASTGGAIWKNTDNAGANDSAWAIIAETDWQSNRYSHYLKATGFTFRIPDPNATILGIEVEVERHGFGAGGGDVTDENVRIVKEGTIGSTDRSNGNSWNLADDFPTGPGDIVTYGSPTDLWGETWTAANINSGLFGFALSADAWSDDDSGTAAIDYIKITVYGTLSQDFIDHYAGGDYCGQYGTLEDPGCWCLCGGPEGSSEIELPNGMYMTLALDESTVLQTGSTVLQPSLLTKTKLVRLKYGSLRVADISIKYSSGPDPCNFAEDQVIDGKAVTTQSFIHGLQPLFAPNSSGYTLYVQKSVSHDTVRVCSGATVLGCKSHNNWSFVANDVGSITQTNGGFDPKDISVSVEDGYWTIRRLLGTGGEGEDSGNGGASVPEFTRIGLILIIFGGVYLIRRIRKIRSKNY